MANEWNEKEKNTHSKQQQKQREQTDVVMMTMIKYIGAKIKGN